MNTRYGTSVLTVPKKQLTCAVGETFTILRMKRLLGIA